MSTGSPPVLGDSFAHEPRRSPRLQDRGVAGREVTATTTTAATGRVVNTTTAATGRVVNTTTAATGRVLTAAGRAVATMAIAGRGVRIPPVGATGPRGRGVKYNKDEIESFLDTMAEFLPIGPQEWEDVTEVHNDRFPLKTTIVNRYDENSTNWQTPNNQQVTPNVHHI